MSRTGGRVILALNCQRPASYGNRGVLRALYGARFPEHVFLVGPGCVADPGYPTLRVPFEPWIPGPCPACPGLAPHAAGIHHLHPRLAAVAGLVGERDHVLFVEDDCVLSPRWTEAAVRARGDAADAWAGPLWWCDPEDDRGWCWPGHATGFAAFGRVDAAFDGARLARHWREVSGQELPPRLDVPLFGGFVDCLVLRGGLLRAMAADLERLAEVWHELAIPTALLQQTPRIGTLQGRALWGSERLRSLEALVGMLQAADFVHPLKLSWYEPAAVLAAYEQVGVAGFRAGPPDRPEAPASEPTLPHRPSRHARSASE
jgi:hypothetical protein